jgi:uncharacterized repeat protein (TIGR03803 family)
LLLAPDGNFYGTAQDGGTSGYGTVFKMTHSGALTTLASFNGTDGVLPVAGLTLGLDGNLYGVAKSGGALQEGTVFRVTTGFPVQPPQFRSFTQSTNQISLVWSAIPGQKYQLQSSTNLVSTNWISVGDAITATNLLVGTSASTSVTSAPAAFYRVVLESAQ